MLKIFPTNRLHWGGKYVYDISIHSSEPGSNATSSVKPSLNTPIRSTAPPALLSLQPGHSLLGPLWPLIVIIC